PSIPVPGMSAIALPIKSATGRTFAALGFGAINERMHVDRIEQVLLPPLRAEVDGLGRKFDLLEAEGLL
ncbi:MAG: hypothetical protein AB8B51_09875, partial [Sedimentitalea sp.]